MPIPTAQERVGSVLAERYLLESLLERGGMGLLYAGRHMLTGRSVAIKVLPDEQAGGIRAERFLREARIAAQLDHPHVVQVFDMGVAPDALFLVMELLQGESLSAFLRREDQFSVAQALDWLVPIMGALSFAHGRGVLHRDVKPANIFLARRGGRVVPMLLDFGIAKQGSADSGTVSGVTLGTPLYMSPEQARGERALTPAADVWSIGMVLHRGLSGHHPFRAESPTGVIGRVLTEAPPSLRVVAPDLPPALSDCIDRALRRDPAERPVDMASFAADLQLAAGRDPATTRDLFATEVTWHFEAKPEQGAATSPSTRELSATAEQPTPAPTSRTGEGAPPSDALRHEPGSHLGAAEVARVRPHAWSLAVLAMLTLLILGLGYARWREARAEGKAFPGVEASAAARANLEARGSADPSVPAAAVGPLLRPLVEPLPSERAKPSAPVAPAASVDVAPTVSRLPSASQDRPAVPAPRPQRSPSRASPPRTSEARADVKVTTPREPVEVDEGVDRRSRLLRVRREYEGR